MTPERVKEAVGKAFDDALSRMFSVYAAGLLAKQDPIEELNKRFARGLQAQLQTHDALVTMVEQTFKGGS